MSISVVTRALSPVLGGTSFFSLGASILGTFWALRESRMVHQEKRYNPLPMMGGVSCGYLLAVVSSGCLISKKMPFRQLVPVGLATWSGATALSSGAVALRGWASYDEKKNLGFKSQTLAMAALLAALISCGTTGMAFLSR